MPLSEGTSGAKNPPLFFPSPHYLTHTHKVRTLTMLMGKEAFKDHKVVHLEDKTSKMGSSMQPRRNDSGTEPGLEKPRGQRKAASVPTGGTRRL